MKKTNKQSSTIKNFFHSLLTILRVFSFQKVPEIFWEMEAKNYKK